jgi:flagellar protein FliO/FliZ
MRRAAVLLSLFGSLSASPAVAAEPAVVPDAPKAELKQPISDIELPKGEPPEVAPVEDLNLGWTLLRTFVVLGIVILAIYITLNFGLRRLMGISAIPRGQAVVQVIERIPLDQKRAMFVVKAAGEYLLIGGGDGALQLISKLDPTEVEKLQQQRPPAIALSPFLQKLLKRREEVPAPPAPGDHS